MKRSDCCSDVVLLRGHCCRNLGETKRQRYVTSVGHGHFVLFHSASFLHHHFAVYNCLFESSPVHAYFDFAMAYIWGSAT